MPIGLHNPCSHLHVLPELANPMTNPHIRLTQYETRVVINKAVSIGLSSWETDLLWSVCDPCDLHHGGRLPKLSLGGLLRNDSAQGMLSTSRGKNTGGSPQYHLSRYDNLPVSRMNLKSKPTAATHLELLWGLRSRSEGCSAISEETRESEPGPYKSQCHQSCKTKCASSAPRQKWQAHALHATRQELGFVWPESGEEHSGSLKPGAAYGDLQGLEAGDGPFLPNSLGLPFLSFFLFCFFF